MLLGRMKMSLPEGPSHRSNDAVDLFFGFFFGILAGIIGGILFAPKPGRELQEDIQDTINKMPDNLTERFSDSKSQYKDFMGRTRYRIESKLERMDERKRASRMAKAKRREEKESGVYDY